MTELIDLEQQKWDAMRRRDADTLGGLYAPNAISVGYGSDGSPGARRTPEFLAGLEDLDLRELSLADFEVLPLGTDGAILMYRASFRTGRGLDRTVLASSVWHREADGWKTMFFQATEVPVTRPA